MNQFIFGKYPILEKQIFRRTELSVAFVNLRPIQKGHVLVSPKRIVERFSMLNANEVSDLWLTAQHVGTRLEKNLNASSLSYVIQDGKSAGQTVHHVHIHIVPRFEGDFKRNDDIYDELYDNKPRGVDNEGRKNRTEKEMEEEATLFSSWM